MSEGMTTRSRALDDQFTTLNDRHDNLLSRLEAVCTTIQQHSDTFELVQKSLAAQQTVMADLMVKVSRLDRLPPPTPLLPSPPNPPLLPSPPSSTMVTATLSPPLPHPPTNTPIPHRLPKLEVPLFSGANVIPWISQIEHFFTFHGILEEQKIDIAAFYMTGPALQWFHWLTSVTQPMTWSDFARQAELHFGPSSFVNPEAELFKLRQRTSVADYLSEFEALSTRVSDLPSRSLLNCFLSGLRLDIQRELYILKPPNLHEAMGMAKLIEDKCNASRPVFLPSRQPLPRPPPAPTLPPAATHRASHAPSSLPIKRLTSTEMAARRERGLCFNCDAKFTPGHRCQTPQFLCLLTDQETDDDTTILEPPSSNHDNPMLDEPPDGDTPCISFHALNGFSGPSTLKLTGSIHSKQVTVLIDGGSTNSFIQSRLAAHLGLVVQPSPHLRVTVGNGEALDCAGACSQVPLQLGEAIFPVDLLLLPIFGADVVLGVHWLSSLGPILFDYGQLWMEFHYHGKLMRLHGILGPNLHYASTSTLKRDTHTHAAYQYLHLTISRHSPANDDSLLPLSSISSSASPSFVPRLQSLLSEYTDIFSLPTGLPPARAYDHRIPLLPGMGPVNIRPYRYPHFQKSEIERLVADMLRDGIIRPSMSPFSSPVILVKKRDSTWRFCVDYRALNAITVKDRFPIPTVEELFDELAGARVFSKMDLRSGYHQVRIYPPDIDKTAFRTHEGHYEFLVMPFGLSNAPSTFQALMNSVFRSILCKFALVFFDDVLIYSPDWDSHLTHLQTIFTLFRTHKLHAKLTKCEFGRLELGYLGHTISSQGVQVDNEKIKAIQQWPIPTSIRTLRGFLGLTGYYRRFVAYYATLAAPLTNLLRKNAFVWTPDASSAFQSLKDALTHTPVLQLPDFTKTFEIHSDASATAIGAVLLQQNHPVAYFSKVLPTRLQTSSAYSREMYAITEAVHRWRQYLLGRRFVIQTDHQSLRSILHQTIQTPDQQRWLTKLLGFDFDIIYKPGSSNVATDALSRIPLPSPELQVMMGTSRPLAAIWEALRYFYKHHQPSAALLTNVQQHPSDHADYSTSNGLLFHKGRLVVPHDSALQHLIISEYHNTPVGGHAGIQRTLKRLSSTFYWPGLRASIRDFIHNCTTCQTVKPFNKAPQGLLQPLPIPGKIWDSISLDFITHLPPSSGKTVILVVVDRLSKQGHFSALETHFSAPRVAEVFLKEVVRLHGVPAVVVSDRDPIFISHFWRELFRLHGTHLAMSSAYHPQSDGQTEILNRYLEDYLRCFVADNPRQWLCFLPLAEWHYNTAYHSSIQMSPYEAVYGRPPPHTARLHSGFIFGGRG